MEISVEVVRKLIKEQFRELSNLEIKLVEKMGIESKKTIQEILNE